MSFKENVARQKSARWAKASTANYDGDDWSDPEEITEENEHEEDNHSFDATPMIKLEEKFDAIDLDQKEQENEEKEGGEKETQETQTYQFHEQAYDYEQEEQEDLEAEKQLEAEEAAEEIEPEIHDEYINAVPVSDDDDDEYRIHKVNTGFDYPNDEEYKPASSRFVSDVPTETADIPLEVESSEVSEVSEALEVVQAPEIPEVTVESPDIDSSDNDSLHIIDEPKELRIEPEEVSESQVDREIARDLSSKSLNGDVLQENAYLGELINTPDPDVQKFEPAETEGASNKEVRDSIFYSSANDYFDDYQDDDEEDEDINTEDINEANEETNEEEKADEADYTNESNKEPDTTQESNELSKTISNASSGSLSTGGVSIRSEGYRFSKLSEKSLASDVQSFNYSVDNSFNNSSINNEDETNEENEDKITSLNPAMSINFGQWRPNTESFRDQFISDSSTTNPTAVPPIPILDNYTRNSNGEIVEDINSVVGSIDASSMVGSESLVEAKEFGKGESYRTDSNSLIATHIPLDSSDSASKDTSHLFQESKSSTPKKLKKSYNMKQISTLDKSTTRIERYRKARVEEANIDTGLNEWISFALEKVEVVTYSTSVSSKHVKQAYAEAASISHQGRRHNNLGSILNKSRVFHETSNTAQSFAKGIFSRGKKIIKNDH